MRLLYHPNFDNHLKCLQKDTIDEIADFITFDSSENEEGGEVDDEKEVEDAVPSKLDMISALDTIWRYAKAGSYEDYEALRKVEKNQKKVTV